MKVSIEKRIFDIEAIEAGIEYAEYNYDSIYSEKNINQLKLSDFNLNTTMRIDNSFLYKTNNGFSLSNGWGQVRNFKYLKDLKQYFK